MVIPSKLVLLLERLFGYKVDGVVIPPPLKERIGIYVSALKYVKKDPKLFTYVLGHRRIVALHRYKKIDTLLLALARKNPSLIPDDFRDRILKHLAFRGEMERIYNQHHFPAAFLRAAE